jgi:hypothetical protein
MISVQDYNDQVSLWPAEGRFILAHYDDLSLIVYQAYRVEIAEYAIKKGYFGGPFSYSRMSWIKPNFLWMMYRSGWGTKPGQEMTLALRLRRSFFDDMLRGAVQSSFVQDLYPTRADWQVAVRSSEVRVQWDPDHDPRGEKLSRRAIQLGLRGSVLEDFGCKELLEVIDMTDFVKEQRVRANTKDFAGLKTPRERVYIPADCSICEKLGLNKREAQQKVERK